MGLVLIGACAIAGWLVLLRLIEAGEFAVGWVFGRLWTVLVPGPKAARGRPAAGIRIVGFLARKLKGWIAFAFFTIMDPFIEIARSLLPAEEEPVPAAGPNWSTRDDAAEDREASSADDDYRQALKELGLRDGMPLVAAQKAWRVIYSKTHPGMGGDTQAHQRTLVAWKTVCARRGWRVD